MNYVNLNDDLIHVGYRWLSTAGRSYSDHPIWCYGSVLPPFIKENEPIVEKLYVQKSYHVETSTVNLEQ